MADSIVFSTSPNSDDPSGANWLKDWINGLLSVGPDSVVSSICQRLIHPGHEPASGDGLMSAQAVATFQTPSESGPTCVSVLRIPFIDTGTGYDRFQSDAVIGAALTLVTDRRCQVLPDLTANYGETGTVLFIPVVNRLDGQLDGPIQPWPEVDSALRGLLAGVASMDQSHAEAITSASHMNYCASLLMPRDVNGAYALIVGGLEALAQEFGEPPTDWASWDLHSTWDKFFKTQSFTPEQADATRRKLLRDKRMRLGETFANYVSSRLPDGFWRENVSIYDWQIDAGSGSYNAGQWLDPQPRGAEFDGNHEILWKALKDAYNTRSRFIHAGDRPITVMGDLVGSLVSEPRPRPSIAQLRACLRTLILLEIESHGDSDSIELPTTTVHC